MKEGLLVILSGPSGVGKGTVRSVLMKDKSLNLVYSISLTTRPPRIGEINGKDYFFTTKEDFEKQLREDGLLEYAKFVNNYYGTPKDFVVDTLKKGKNVLLEIETNGAKQVMEKCRDINFVSIFLLPPSFDDLKARITNRHTETEKVINERLEKAKKEITLASLYQYNVVNDTPENAANAIKEIIIKNSK